MSGYSSLHREQVIIDETSVVAIWKLATCSLLSSKSNQQPSPSQSAAASWRVLAACSDGVVRVFRVHELSLQDKSDALNAAALDMHCTRVLSHDNNRKQHQHQHLGYSYVSVARNHVGDNANDTMGDLIVVALELSGILRVWTLSETMDDGDDCNKDEVRTPTHEFSVPNATGTTALICPPRLSGVGSVTVAVGCLDGTVSMVTTGLATPNANGKHDPSQAGTVLDTWGSRGSAIPLSMHWHPIKPHVLAVGRQDGMIDILTASKRDQHRIARHKTPVRALAFTDDGHLLIAGSDSGMLTVFDMERSTPTLVHHVMAAHASWILDIVTLDDSRRFVTCGADQKLHVWNVSQLHQPMHTFQTDQAVVSIARGPKGRSNRLVTASDSGHVQVYSLEN
jgi:WD40 repeat protein